MYQFAPHLEAAGAIAEFLPFFDERYLEGYFGQGRKRAGDVVAAYRRRVAALRRVRGADLVWIEKEAFPFLPAIAALNRLGRERPVTFVTVGAGILSELTIPQEQHSWSEDSEAALLARTHIGVMPLPDEPWERGKCAYKLIQYMAAGRPVIASAVGMNIDVVTPDVGFLATDEDAWLTALRLYASDPIRRQAMGRAGRQRVAEHYSLRMAAPKIVDWFARIIDRGTT